MIASAGQAAVHGAPDRALVRTSVRRAWRALVVRRALESVAVALAALSTCLAAAVHSGADLRSADAWVASGVVGCLTLGSWWLEHSTRESSVARRLDWSASQDGALVTAFECEIRRVPSGVQELLSRRVAHDLVAHAPMRVALTPALSILAAPLAAGALLALALESGQSRSAHTMGARTLALAEHARALVAAVDQARAALSSDVAEEVRVIARSAAALSSVEAAAPALADLESRARALAERLSEHRLVQRALEETAAQARDLAAALARGSPGAGLADADGGGGAGLALPRGAVPDPATGRAPAIVGPGPAAPADRESRTGMVAGPPDVTMPRLDPDQRHTPEPDPAAAAAKELGLSAVRWWPRRFDVIVERWVEHERAVSDR